MPFPNKLNEAVNTGRQPEFDWSKAIAIVCMILVHTNLYYGENTWIDADNIFSSLSSAFAYCIDLIGATATAFMFCLGVGIVYSKRSTAPYLLKRGIILVLTGILLNCIIKIPSLLIREMVTGNHLGHIFDYIFDSNILIFAGLTFMFFALIKKFNMGNIKVIILALALFIISLIIPVDLCPPHSIIGAIVGAFVPQELNCSLFSFTNWILYPVAGYLFGQILLTISDKRTFYKRVFMISAAFAVLIISIVFILNMNILEVFYSLENSFETPFSVICELILLHILLTLIYQLSSVFSKNRISALVYDVSKKLPQIYIAQWFIIVWSLSILILLLGYFSLPIPWILVLSVIFLIVSYFAATLYLKIKNSLKIRINSSLAAR